MHVKLYTLPHSPLMKQNVLHKCSDDCCDLEDSVSYLGTGLND
jgi:hypothetical protein